MVQKCVSCIVNIFLLHPSCDEQLPVYTHFHSCRSHGGSTPPPLHTVILLFPKIGSSFIVTVCVVTPPFPQFVIYNVNFTFKPAQLPYEQNLECSKMSNSRDIAIGEIKINQSSIILSFKDLKQFTTMMICCQIFCTYEFRIKYLIYCRH